ncbi:hypothetical protein CCO03_02255 [Comamonas serinivorans]|uniref:Cell shape determination protein CcmA n=1 Tax=Comamonas serinivorans TaxID=1082851 RepID=A0A1Y0EJA7_9BURK|nr:polymer-forming cytoskeletal protein [Comamonas serinivorans]ARU03666.1 hypothetical protein CCO03_02255 [Comamonas serinivorans]
MSAMTLPTPSQAPRGLLPKGSQLRGELNVAQGLRIEGELYGNVRALDSQGATVVVADGATVIGAIEAAHVIVQGQVQGPIVATQQLQVLAGAQIDGELHYLHLDLHPQALVRGSLIPILGVSDAQALPSTTAGASDEGAAADAAPAQADDEAKGPTARAVKGEADPEAEGGAVPSTPAHV